METETYGKTFFFPEIWSIKYIEKNGNFFVSEDAQCSETDLYMLWTVVRFLVFETWSIL